MTEATCSIDGCEKPHRARGWCSTHYNRWRETGDPGEAVPDRDPAARFWRRVDRGGVDDCWLWTGPYYRRGYGQFSVDSVNCYAHRFAYELLIGPIPDDLDLDHLCRNPPCVNPAHLEPVTHAENVLRGESPTAVNARKTHCIRGHEFSPRENGWRVCRECQRDSERRYRARKRRQS